MQSALKPDTNWVDGVIKVEAPTETGKFGIEEVYSVEGELESHVAVDVDAWIDAIKSNVAGWFETYNTNNDYASVQDALDNCTDVVALGALANCYNVQYNSEWNTQG